MATTMAMQTSFDGQYSNDEIPGLGLIRSESMDVINDPRVFGGNILFKRMGAFHLISFAAVVMCVLSVQNLLGMEQPSPTPIQYAAMIALTLTFILNLMTVVVIVVQVYHMTRLSTVGPMGFETSASYYMHPDITTLRHGAARIFFVNVVVLLVAIALTIYVKFKADMTFTPSMYVFGCGRLLPLRR